MLVCDHMPHFRSSDTLAFRRWSCASFSEFCHFGLIIFAVPTFCSVIILPHFRSSVTWVWSFFAVPTLCSFLWSTATLPTPSFWQFLYLDALASRDDEAVKALQQVRFTASLIASLQRLSIVCRSLSAVCHQFISGRPLFLWPWGYHWRTGFASLQGGNLATFPSRLRRRLRIISVQDAGWLALWLLRSGWSRSSWCPESLGGIFMDALVGDNPPHYCAMVRYLLAIDTPINHVLRCVLRLSHFLWPV